jgi:predicted Zn-dependent protease
MPSHIFTRLGLWDESIDSNLRSIAVAGKMAGMQNDALHAADYLVYAYLQTGRDKAAHAVQENARAGELDATHLGGPFALAAIDARLALEPGDWAAASTLPLHSYTLFPEVEAVTRYARAIGLTRLSRPDAARPELAALASLAQALHAKGSAYWEEQVEIQLLAAGAWLTYAEGAHDEGVAQARAAAALEATTNKNVVTPGPLAPARELLAEMLLDAGQPADARLEFEQVLAVEPRRFRSLYGAARAAELSKDIAQAKQGYADLLQFAAKADTDRPELQAARAFLASH